MKVSVFSCLVSIISMSIFNIHVFLDEITDQSFCVGIDLEKCSKSQSYLVFLIPKKRSNILNLVNIYVPIRYYWKIRFANGADLSMCYQVLTLFLSTKKALPALRGRSLLHLLSIFSFQVKPIVLLALCPDLFTDCHAHCWGGVVYKHKNGL